ncbi:MAG: hypothetical protein H0W86_07390, partial [Armatimonadetes bacterium]|nr:hypothetical protein [Armatimonadota bacterium]
MRYVMTKRSITPVAFLAFSCLFVSSPAQEAQGKSVRTQSFDASRLDTRTFSPQIDDAYVFHAKRPENPIEIPVPPFTQNDLPVGRIRDVVRTQMGPLFPAIGATGWTPADPDLAVGQSHIVATVNSSIAFFTKAGVSQFQQTSENFFAGMGAGTFQFDPKCFYDRVHNRFVLIFLEQADTPRTSKILMAVSDDDDPNGTWYRYRLESKLVIGTSEYWLDYPGFGYNKDAFVICGNMFGFTTGFAGVYFLVIPSGSVLSGGSAPVNYMRDSSGASAQVAEMIDAAETKVFAISRNGSSAVKVYALTNVGGTPSWQSASVTVPTNSAPTIDAASTSGRTLDSLDGRIFNTNWRGGKLMATHTIQSGSFLRARWYEINTNSWPTSGSPSLSMSGDVAAGSAHHHMPAINRNSVGDVSMIFTRSSSTITADIMCAGRAAGDPAGTMGTPVLLEGSAGNNYTQGRWGDYFGCDVDPVDDTTFWGIGMGVASTNNWRTSIFSWTISGEPPPPPGAELIALTLSDYDVVGGVVVPGTVTLSAGAPVGGAQVTMTSSHPSIASVPSSVTVAGGATSANFNVTTVRPPRTTNVTISA